MSDKIECIINFQTLRNILTDIHGYSFEDATCITDYLTECIDYCIDLDGYIWNTLLFEVEICKDMDEVDRYLDNNGLDMDDIKLFKSMNGMIYIEKY